MTIVKKTGVAGLDFDADAWSCEKALPEIFLSDLDHDGPRSLCEKIVKYLLNEADVPSIEKDSHLWPVRKLKAYLGKIFLETELVRGEKYSPIVWCRVAIQFWLSAGGRQAVFMAGMTEWLGDQYWGSYPVVEPQQRADAERYQVPVEVFLFAAKLRCPLSSGWQLKSEMSMGMRRILKKKVPVRTKEDEVGRNLLATVRAAVKALRTDWRTRKHFVTGLDVKTGKVRFRGRRDDLYDLISRRHDEIGVVPGRKENDSITRYKKSTVIRAISTLAICRRSWLSGEN